MQNFIIILTISLTAFSCNELHQQEVKIANETHINQKLIDELSRMDVIDQIAALNAYPPQEYQHLKQDQWESVQDSIFRTHKTRLEEIIKEFGYPGFDLVGTAVEKSFWMMVQHADFDPAFQGEVLQLLAVEVENKNANSRNFGLLTDRVRLNTGRKQIYATQVRYVIETGQAFPKPLEDSVNVNIRRKQVGLESLEEYLNVMTTMHFEMNKKNMNNRGITEPKLYIVPEDY